MQSSWCARQEKLGRGSRWFARDDGSNSGNGSLLSVLQAKKYIYIITPHGCFERNAWRPPCTLYYPGEYIRQEITAGAAECVDGGVCHTHTHTTLSFFCITFIPCCQVYIDIYVLRQLDNAEHCH